METKKSKGVQRERRMNPGELQTGMVPLFKRAFSSLVLQRREDEGVKARGLCWLPFHLTIYWQTLVFRATTAFWQRYLIGVFFIFQ